MSSGADAKVSIEYDASPDALFHPEKRPTTFVGRPDVTLPGLAVEAARLAYLQGKSDPAESRRLADALRLTGFGLPAHFVDRATGALSPAGVLESGTSPSCLAINAAGTRLYSANETDRVGDDKQGTVSAYAIDRSNGGLKLLNTVRSGGAVHFPRVVSPFAI